MEKDLGKTSINVEPKVAALLAYAAGFVSGIIFFVIEKENRFVRFHAMQSIILFGAMFVLQMSIVYLPFIRLIAPLVTLGSLALWIVCMIKAYQGEMFKLPVIGDLAEKQLDRPA